MVSHLRVATILLSLGVIAQAEARDEDLMWQVGNGFYGPAIYCSGQYTESYQLPPLGLAQKRNCAIWISRSTERNKTRWRSVEAENGALFRIDMESIKAGWAGGLLADVYASEGEDDLRYQRGYGQRMVYFDCRDHFTDLDSPLIYAPPRSVMGVISSIVCKSKGG